MRRFRAVLIPLLLVLAPLAVLITSARVVNEIQRTQEAEVALERLRTKIVGLQVIPWDKDANGLSRLWTGGEDLATIVDRELVALERKQPDHSLDRLRTAIDANRRAAATVSRKPRADLSLTEVLVLAKSQRSSYMTVERELERTTNAYRAHADRLDERRHVVGVLIVLVLGASTGIAVYRSRRARRRVEDLAAENARLLAASRDEALSDALTGLRNRRALYAALDERFAAPEVAPFVLVLFDLDNFKELNDRFGHPAGDAALVELARTLEQADGDAYRLGGDEFCLLIDDADGTGDQHAFAARRALVHSHEETRVTASLGLAHLPREACGTGAAMRLADSRLYADKRQRRPLAA